MTQVSGIYPQECKDVQHSKVNWCNLPYQQTKEENPYDYFNDAQYYF